MSVSPFEDQPLRLKTRQAASALPRCLCLVTATSRPYRGDRLAAEPAATPPTMPKGVPEEWAAMRDFATPMAVARLRERRPSRAGAGAADRRAALWLGCRACPKPPKSPVRPRSFEPSTAEPISTSPTFARRYGNSLKTRRTKDVAACRKELPSPAPCFARRRRKRRHADANRGGMTAPFGCSVTPGSLR